MPLQAPYGDFGSRKAPIFKHVKGAALLPSPEELGFRAKNKMNLAIKDLIGTRCIIKEDGQKVYDIIHKPLRHGDTITLDFAGVTQFASPFFNFAVGQLLKDVKQEELRRLLKIVNLESIGLHVVRRVIENASQYQTDVNYQKVIDDILELQAKESG